MSKHFDEARTPYQRVMDSGHVTQRAKRTLRKIYLSLNPAQLKRDLAVCQARLLQLTNQKPATRKEVRRPGPPLKGALSKAHASRTSLVMQPELASRTS